jgi:hypothetical protein
MRRQIVLMLAAGVWVWAGCERNQPRSRPGPYDSDVDGPTVLAEVSPDPGLLGDQERVSRQAGRRAAGGAEASGSGLEAPPPGAGGEGAPPAGGGTEGAPGTTGSPWGTPPATGGGESGPPATGGGESGPPATGGGESGPPATGGGESGPPATGGGEGAPAGGGTTPTGMRSVIDRAKDVESRVERRGEVVPPSSESGTAGGDPMDSVRSAVDSLKEKLGAGGGPAALAGYVADADAKLLRAIAQDSTAYGKKLGPANEALAKVMPPRQRRRLEMLIMMDDYGAPKMMAEMMAQPPGMALSYATKRTKPTFEQTGQTVRVTIPGEVDPIEFVATKEGWRIRYTDPQRALVKAAADLAAAKVAFIDEVKANLDAGKITRDNYEEQLTALVKKHLKGPSEALDKIVTQRLQAG